MTKPVRKNKIFGCGCAFHVQYFQRKGKPGVKGPKQLSTTHNQIYRDESRVNHDDELDESNLNAELKCALCTSLANLWSLDPRQHFKLQQSVWWTHGCCGPLGKVPYFRGIDKLYHQFAPHVLLAAIGRPVAPRRSRVYEARELLGCFRAALHGVVPELVWSDYGEGCFLDTVTLGFDEDFNNMQCSQVAERYHLLDDEEEDEVSSSSSSSGSPPSAGASTSAAGSAQRRTFAEVPAAPAAPPPMPNQVPAPANVAVPPPPPPSAGASTSAAGSAQRRTWAEVAAAPAVPPPMPNQAPAPANVAAPLPILIVPVGYNTTAVQV